jgi:hypothetical protein
MQTNGVRCLLIGGQACVLYGAAEFSRDTDLVIQTDAGNLACLRSALTELQAECIAVPPFEKEYLDLGLAVHFRCGHPEAKSLRIDVMSRLRGVDDFPRLWERRTVFDLDGQQVNAIGLADLVQAKKTQREKDWPMITRLLERHYLQHQQDATPERVDFWLRELRTLPLLMEVAARFPERRQELEPVRPILRARILSDEAILRTGLRIEMEREQEADRVYWEPLKRKLEELRLNRSRKA